jgi:type VI secretion system (T6SS) effector TldE1-like protein
MTDAVATFYAVPTFDGRIFSLGDCRRLLRLVGGNVLMGLGAVAAVGVLVTTVTLAAAWIVSTILSNNPYIHARTPTGPGALALVQDGPTFASAPVVTFEDRWPRTTASMQASAMPLLPEQPLEIADNVPMPPSQPLQVPHRQAKPEIAYAHGLTSVPLPRPHPTQHEIALAPVGQAAARIATAMLPPAPPVEKRVAPQQAHNKSLSPPAPDSRIAVYDISAHTVYLPNGDRLEAHSGLGDKLDDPRYVNVRMRGPTPPNVYELTMREQLFHGVRAIRLNPVDDGKMFGRDGMLAHTYMLGANGQSNGCVSFRDYQKFLNAYLRGEVDRLVVVANLGTKPSLTARARHGRNYRYASND